MTLSRYFTALAICGTAAVMAGCSASVSVGGNTVKQAGEISSTKKFIAASLPDLPPVQSVDCPSGVDAKVDTTFECRATLDNGQEVTIPFQVASINGDHVDFKLNTDVVTHGLAVDVVYKAADSPPKSVDCPTDVQAVKGKTFDCQLTFENGKVSTLTLKVVNATSSGQNLTVARVRRG
jgi:predicted thioesterase